jgi:hypothetical protein
LIQRTKEPLHQRYRIGGRPHRQRFLRRVSRDLAYIRNGPDEREHLLNAAWRLKIGEMKHTLDRLHGWGLTRSG